MPFGRILNALDAYLAQSGLYYTVSPVSIYQPEDSTTKNLSFHLKFSDPTRTLTSEDISAIMEHIRMEVSNVGAEIV